MKTNALFFILFLANIFTTSFLHAQASKPQTEGTWKIKTLKDSGKMLDIASKETTVEISVKGKSILAYVGCNRLTANLEFITSDLIKPMQLVATRKSCKGDTETLENATRYVMEQTNSIRKNGARLEFFKDNELLMVLERPTDTKKKK
jgi:heat shock protein HslJ